MVKSDKCKGEIAEAVELRSQSNIAKLRAVCRNVKQGVRDLKRSCTLILLLLVIFAPFAYTISIEASGKDRKAGRKDEEKDASDRL